MALNIATFESMYVVKIPPCVVTVNSFRLLCNMLFCDYIIRLFIHYFIDGHLGCFHVFAILLFQNSSVEFQMY